MGRVSGRHRESDFLTGAATRNAVDLNSMTKAQLLDYAGANGVEGVSGSMRKADIIKTIEEA